MPKTPFFHYLSIMIFFHHFSDLNLVHELDVGEAGAEELVHRHVQDMDHLHNTKLILLDSLLQESYNVV